MHACAHTLDSRIDSSAPRTGPSQVHSEGRIWTDICDRLPLRRDPHSGIAPGRTRTSDPRIRSRRTALDRPNPDERFPCIRGELVASPLVVYEPVELVSVVAVEREP